MYGQVFTYFLKTGGCPVPAFLLELFQRFFFNGGNAAESDLITDNGRGSPAMRFMLQENSGQRTIVQFAYISSKV